MKVLAVIGPSGSGKTTLLEALLPVLARCGLRTAAVKHTHHPPAGIDRPGSDSARLFAAGANAVALAGPGVCCVFQPGGAEPSLEEILARLPAVDLVLLESWKALAVDAIEVVAADGQRVAATVGGKRLQVVSGGPARPPVFGDDTLAALCRTIVEWCARRDA